MSDDVLGPDGNKNEPKKPVNQAHEDKMRELFGDLEEFDDERPTDTVESLRAERDELTQKVIQLSSLLNNSQTDNLTLSRKAEEMKQSVGRAEEKFERDKKYALEKFIKDVLPVIDTLELGLNAISQKDRDADPKFKKLAEGVEKTIAQLTGVFNKYGIREINPVNQAFDENKHEVITTRLCEDVEPETVVQVTQKGYEIEGRLIRPAKVIVTPPC